MFHSVHLHRKSYYSFMMCVLLFAGACKKEDSDTSPNPTTTATPLCAITDDVGTPYNFEKPYFFPNPILPEFNPMTLEGIALGRELFWDKALSKTNTISCGSCHMPTSAFTDNIERSIGLYGDETRRNSMALVNLAWNTTFFWDGRDHSLEEQILEPVHNPIEMDMAWSQVVDRVAADFEYQELFLQAFGSSCVDSIRISYAIAQFVRTMVSAESKFDRAFYLGGAFLSESEQRGQELFQAEGGDPNIFPGGQNGGDCFHCHGGALIQFTDHQFHNNGLDAQIVGDLGREEVTGFALDRGLFRTPTLRNIALTAPYMHDGRFATLHDVLNHYNSGGHNSPTIDPLMKFPDQGLGLSPQDIDDLVNFLNTLTDTSFVNNPRFSDPN